MYTQKVEFGCGAAVQFRDDDEETLVGLLARLDTTKCPLCHIEDGDQSPLWQRLALQLLNEVSDPHMREFIVDRLRNYATRTVLISQSN